MRYSIVALWILFLGTLVGTLSREHDLRVEVNQLAEQQAVQAVQLQDARDRVRELEVDLDRIAPHTPRSP